MLAGDPDRVKPDVHIHHCITDALEYDVSNKACQEIFTGAVEILRERCGLLIVYNARCFFVSNLTFFLIVLKVLTILAI